MSLPWIHVLRCPQFYPHHFCNSSENTYIYTHIYIYAYTHTYIHTYISFSMNFGETVIYCSLTGVPSVEVSLCSLQVPVALGEKEFSFFPKVCWQLSPLWEVELRWKSLCQRQVSVRLPPPLVGYHCRCWGSADSDWWSRSPVVGSRLAWFPLSVHSFPLPSWCPFPRGEQC